MNNYKPTLTVWNHNQKLRAKGFSDIIKADQFIIQSGQEIIVEGKSIGKGGQHISALMKCKVVCAHVDTWANIQQNPWLVHEHIGLFGAEAEAYYKKNWPDLNPAQKMIAIRLHRIETLK